MAEKTVNYTPEMEQVLRDVYDVTADEATRSDQINEIVEKVGRNRRSVIAKLSRMNLYVKKEYKNKRGEKPVSKGTLVAFIAKECGATEDQFDSLSKATKPVLATVASVLWTRRESVEAETS
jgi:Tfp pilus assembly protein PilP